MIVDMRNATRRKCAYCGGPATAVDHVHPRAFGGTDDPDNMVDACQPCNSKKGTLPVELVGAPVAVIREFLTTRGWTPVVPGRTGKESSWKAPKGSGNTSTWTRTAAIRAAAFGIEHWAPGHRSAAGVPFADLLIEFRTSYAADQRAGQEENELTRETERRRSLAIEALVHAVPCPKCNAVGESCVGPRSRVHALWGLPRNLRVHPVRRTAVNRLAHRTDGGPPVLLSLSMHF